MQAYIVLIFLIGGAFSTCDIHPQFWCDSLQVAEQCGVEKACQEWLRIDNADPVHITLYFESLCPGCRDFIKTQFYPTWKMLQESEIMESSMVPYGNAKEVHDSDGSWNYTCQHGAEECTGNLIENCIIHFSEDVFDTYFPIIHCMEIAEDPIKAAQMCVEKSTLEWGKVDACAKGKEGNELMHKSALKTGALEPPHKYVPWIVANGKHTEAMQQEAQTDLLKFVCNTYTGKKPAQCQQQMQLKSFRKF